MKKLFFIGACLLALSSSPAMAQTGGADVVVVKVYEYAGEQHIAVTYAGGKTEEIASKAGRGNLPESGVALQKVFATLYQQGYSLRGSVSTYAGNIGTFILVK